MTDTQNIEGLEQDPELLDRDDVTGAEEAYDQVAVQTVQFDFAQFELADDFEYEDDEDDDAS